MWVTCKGKRAAQPNLIQKNLMFVKYKYETEIHIDKPAGPDTVMPTLKTPPEPRRGQATRFNGKESPLKRLLPCIVMLTFLMGCAQLERLRPTPSQDAAKKPPEPAIRIGMSSLAVVKTIGFPDNGASLGDCAGVKHDVWVYDDGDLLLIFKDGQLSGVVGPGGERPSIRLYR